MSNFQPRNQSEYPSEDTANDQDLKKDSSSSLLQLDTLSRIVGIGGGALVGSSLGPVGMLGGIALGYFLGGAAAEFISENLHGSSANRRKTTSSPSQHKRRDTGRLSHHSTLNTKESSQKQERYLALVVGADAENLCAKIRNQEGIYREDWEYLYAKTQDLLLTDVVNKSLESLLSIQREYEGSEYSVYIILMTLHPQTDKDRDLIERGFRVGASPLDREDAFERLPDLACNVRVSDCLPPTSYQDRGFYQC